MNYPKQLHPFTFDPATHVYRDLNGRELESVSSFCSRHEPDIDWVAKALQMSDGDESLAEILREKWLEKKNDALRFGIAIDEMVSDYLLTGEVREWDKEVFTYEAFHVNFYNDLDKLLMTFPSDPLTQIAFADPENSVAGTTDLIFSSNNSWDIIDVKTSARKLSMKKSSKYGYVCMKEPFQLYPHCSFTRYAIQLSAYAMLMRKNDNFVNILNLKIWQVHRNGHIEIVDVPFIDEIKYFF